MLGPIRSKIEGIIDVEKESNHKLLHAMKPRNFWYRGMKFAVDSIEYGYVVDEVESIGGAHLVAYKNTTDIDGEVIMDSSGNPIKTPVTIKYQQIPTMLHTELKYQYEIIEKLTSRVVDLDDENALLTATVRDLNTTVQNLNTTIYVLLDRLHAVEKIIYPDTA